MSIDLKLCPFCGDAPELCDGDIVQCLACDVRRYPPQAWNEREPDRLVDAKYINMKSLVKQSAIELEEAAKLFEGHGLHTLASIYRKASERNYEAVANAGSEAA